MVPLVLMPIPIASESLKYFFTIVPAIKLPMIFEINIMIMRDNDCSKEKCVKRLSASL